MPNCLNIFCLQLRLYGPVTTKAIPRTAGLCSKSKLSSAAKNYVTGVTLFQVLQFRISVLCTKLVQDCF